MAFSLTQFQRHLTLAGYAVRDVPYIERADIFSTKGGDRVIEHLLTFDYGNIEYALRPEFTASAARAFASAHESVVRWQFSGPVFEDRAGNGDHAFQRQSAGVELLGMSGPLADSEVIGLAASGLTEQGLGDFQIVIGHAGLTRKLIERFTSDPQLIHFLLNQRAALSDPAQGREAVEATLAGFLNLRGTGGALTDSADNAGLSELLASVTLRTSTLGGRTRDDIAQRLLRKQRRTDDVSQILRAVETLEAWVSLRGAASVVMPQIYQLAEDTTEFAGMAADLHTTLDLLEGFGIAPDSVILQPDLNRIWEYYSGIVFELRAPDDTSLGGGGRYDGLLRLLGSVEDAPAVGFQINAGAVAKLAGGTDDLPRVISLVGGRPHANLVLKWASDLRALGVACAIYETVPDPVAPVVIIDAVGAHVVGHHFAPGSAKELAAFLRGAVPSMTEPILLALPSKGAIAEPTLNFLKECGLRVDKPNDRQYVGSVPSVPGLNVLFQRVKDVVYKVSDGTVQLGVTGYDVVRENPHQDLVVVHSGLGYGHCHLVVAVPESWVDVDGMSDLSDVASDMRRLHGRSLRVASTYGGLTRQFLHAQGIHHFTLVRAEGAIEAAPTIGYADIIVDLVQTGTTLRENHLKPLHDGVIVESQACLVGNINALRSQPETLAVAQIMLEFIDASLQGKQYRQLTVNIRGDSPEDVARKVTGHPVTRGLKGPTIAPIYGLAPESGGGQWFTVTINVNSRDLLKAVDHLRQIGSSQVVVSPVNFVFQEQSPSYARLLELLGQK